MRENQRGFTVWFTGLPCSGKTTIAHRVADTLIQDGYAVEVLDGDNVRKDLCSDLGFSKKDRDENIRRVTFVAKLLTRHGVIVVASFVSPYQTHREYARRILGSFVEIYVKCPLEVCIQRDVKGMYKKARTGEIKAFTGVDDVYEEPKHPDLILYSDKETIDESTQNVIKKLKELKYI
ncbi:MAG: adenylyl-sulfate kinase [Candidatus Thermoplasmatota archaeon]